MRKRQISILLGAAIFITVVIVIVYKLVFAPHAEIIIQGEEIRLKHNYNSNHYTAIWECDAGTLSLKDTDSVYSGTTDSGYYLYAGINDAVLWTPQDHDGFLYETATLKVHLFPFENGAFEKVGEVTENADTKTISLDENILTLSPARTFGNPIRKDADDDWQQILVLDETPDSLILRYRCGKEISSDKMVVWNTNIPNLCNVYLASTPPYAGVQEYNDKAYLLDASTVCFDFSRIDGAFYFDDKDADLYPKEIEISAFLANRAEKNDENQYHSDTGESVAEFFMKYDIDGKIEYHTVK